MKKFIIFIFAFMTVITAPVFAETQVKITVNNHMISGTLNDTPVAMEFLKMLPHNITMSNYGGREIYGGIPNRINAVGELKTTFEDGEITYCPQNNTVAIFYAQTNRPVLGMQVIKIGKVHSKLDIFKTLGSSVKVRFEVK